MNHHPNPHLKSLPTTPGGPRLAAAPREHHSNGRLGGRPKGVLLILCGSLNSRGGEAT